MIVEVKDVNVANVWAESFKDRETGEPVEYYRALCNRVGEPPTQLAVSADDFQALQACIGMTGKATIEIVANPGRRVRVLLKSIG